MDDQAALRGNGSAGQARAGGADRIGEIPAAAELNDFFKLVTRSWNDHAIRPVAVKAEPVVFIRHQRRRVGTNRFVSAELS